MYYTLPPTGVHMPTDTHTHTNAHTHSQYPDRAVQMKSGIVPMPKDEELLTTAPNIPTHTF